MYQQTPQETPLGSGGGGRPQPQGEMGNPGFQPMGQPHGFGPIHPDVANAFRRRLMGFGHPGGPPGQGNTGVVPPNGPGMNGPNGRWAGQNDTFGPPAGGGGNQAFGQNFNPHQNGMNTPGFGDLGYQPPPMAPNPQMGGYGMGHGFMGMPSFPPPPVDDGGGGPGGGPFGTGGGALPLGPGAELGNPGFTPMGSPHGFDSRMGGGAPYIPPGPPQGPPQDRFQPDMGSRVLQKDRSNTMAGPRTGWQW